MTEWCGWPVVPESTGWEAAQQILIDAELSDGLPLVPPTQRRLDAMAAVISGRAESHGMIPPMFDDITPEAVAYQCVIAGARPAELPVVLAAATATLEPDFNLLGIATTTGTACVALCVHGPIARQLGINGGTNCLGPGNRANASIGRALQLCIRNICGARSDVVSDAGLAHMLELVPQAEVIDVQAAGHMVAGDDNDVFAQRLEDFLERLSDGPRTP